MRKRESKKDDQDRRRKAPRATRVASRWKIPIAVKFSVLIAGLSVALLAWQARTAIQTAEAHLERGINDSGIQLVSTLAVLIDSEWLTDLSRQEEVLEFLRRIKTERGTSSIQEVIIRNQLGEAVALLAQISVSSQESTIDYPPALDAEVTITEHEADEFLVRNYTKQIRAEVNTSAERKDNEEEVAIRGLPLGSVSVFLSSNHIRDSKSSLASEMITVSIVGCLAAAAASFLLATWITRSIRVLVRDMRAVSHGQLDHQTEVDSSDELGDLGRSFNLMTSSLQEAQETKLAQKALEHELSVATRIQSGLLPSKLPEIAGLELGVYYASAKEVGGDYYDFVEINDQYVGVVVADVSGKGVPGSLVMTMTRTLLRSAAKRSASPDQAVKELNRSLCPDLEKGLFVTLLYFVIDRKTRDIHLVRAGHNAPIYYSRSHDKMIDVQPNGIAIGLDPSGTLFERELAKTKFQMHKDDLFVAYTDGVIEEMSPGGQEYGATRLRELIAAHRDSSAAEIVSAINEDLLQHRRRGRGSSKRASEQADDITIVVLKGR